MFVNNNFSFRYHCLDLKMGPEHLVLHWDEFHTQFSCQLLSLREDEELLDCDLYCEDGQMAQAHKVVLASCSSYFRNLLRRVGISFFIYKL